MKALLKLLIFLIVLLLVAAVAAPFVIPAESYKAEIIQRVKAATGRELTIGGPLRLSLLPMPGVHIEKAALANPKGYDASDLIQVQSADVQVELMPLLSGQVQVKSLVLNKPVIDLEVNAQGVPNWRFTPQDAIPEMPVRQSERDGFIAAAEAAEPKARSAVGALSALKEIQISDVRITDGVLRYADHRTQNVTTLENANFHMAIPGLKLPFSLSGTARLDGQELSVDAKVNSPQALMSGSEAAITLSITSTPLHLTASGNASLTGLKMDIDASTPSLPGLSEWALGSKPEWKGKTPLAFSVKGNLDCTPANCVLDGAVMKLDQAALAGKLGVSWLTRPLYIAADLRADALDITPFLPEEKSKAASLLVSDAWAETSATGWSTAPIDFSALHALNTDIKLNVGKFTAHSFTADKAELSAALKDGVLKVNVPSAGLYGGQGKGDLTLSADAAQPSVDTHITLSGVQVQPLLTEVAQFDRLSGKADFTLHAGGRGANERDLMSGLSGDGKLSVADGTLKGVDLGQLARTAKTLLAGAAPAGGQGSGVTSFSSLTGSYTITHGIVHNADLMMNSQLLTMRGAGDVNLPTRYVHYRLTPSLADTSKGKSKGAQGLGVPVVVDGPFENISFRPDVKGAVKGALKNPAAARDAVKSTVKSLKDQLKSGGLQNMLNGLGR